MVLERELATFKEKLPELLATAPSKYVLVHGEDVAGTWDTWGEAIDAGYERFGLEPFLVKQIVEREEAIHVSQNVL